jgi:CheY-like chemotaxis protein
MPKTILIVEDYADTRSFLKCLLKDSGYEVAEAENGQEAIKSIKLKTPDLILMDIAMPEMDGLTATRTIRRFDGMAELPIIAFTASRDLFYKRAIEAGCDELVDKPLRLDALTQVLNQYLEKTPLPVAESCQNNPNAI